MIKRILLLEDDPEVVHLLSAYLEKHHYKVVACENAEQARLAIKNQSFSLILLDVMLPGTSGLEFCKEVRLQSSVPIIFVTALGQVIDRVVGLELGADDYIVKPFDPRELLARMKNILRRAEGPDKAAGILAFDELEINLKERAVRQNKVLIDLSSSEYAALMILVERAGKVVTRETLLENLRGVETEAFDRAIDTTISRLRTKLGDDARNPRYIKTVWGLGYSFVGVERHL